jgi:signal transduction histidine kinase
MFEEVDTARTLPGSVSTETDRMVRETNDLLATSRALLKQVDELLEENRQLRAVNAALMEQRKQNKEQ